LPPFAQGNINYLPGECNSLLEKTDKFEKLGVVKSSEEIKQEKQILRDKRKKMFGEVFAPIKINPSSDI